MAILLCKSRFRAIHCCSTTLLALPCQEYKKAYLPCDTPPTIARQMPLRSIDPQCLASASVDRVSSRGCLRSHICVHVAPLTSNIEIIEHEINPTTATSGGAMDTTPGHPPTEYLSKLRGFMAKASASFPNFPLASTTSTTFSHGYRSCFLSHV